MKSFAYSLLGAMLFAGLAHPQETQVLVENQQLKVEVTKYSESCAVLRTGKESADAVPAGGGCVELAITNSSRVPITAWLATVEREGPGAPRKIVGMGMRASDSIMFAGGRSNNPEVLPRDTHRVIVGNPTRVDFKAAVFQDGSVFGDRKWVGRIVQNRREVYQDIAESLKRLRAAGQAGTPREQIIRDFQELQRDEREQDQAAIRNLPREESLRLPRLGVYEMVAMDLTSSPVEGSTLGNDLNRVEAMLLDIASRLFLSRPHLAERTVPIGEPFDSPLPPEYPGPPAPAPQASATPGPANPNASQPLPSGPRTISEAAAELQQGRLRIWVPRTFLRGMPTIPAEERYHDYQWEGLQKEFKNDFPDFALQVQELDLPQYIRVFHEPPEEVSFPDAAFIDNYGELRPLLKANAVVQMWGQSRLQYRGWWVAFRRAKNFAAAESFLLWVSQGPHWTPWNVSTKMLDARDVAAVQNLAQEAVRAYEETNGQSLGSVLDPEAARFVALGPNRIQTLLSVEPLLTFGNSRLAFVLLTAVGAGDSTFGMDHFGAILRKTEAGWKVWSLVSNRPLPDLEQLFQSFDRLGLEEAGAQALPKITLRAPADHAQVSQTSRPEIEWSTVDAPLATYVVESQYTVHNPGTESWAASKIDLVSPISVGPTIRIPAPFGGGDDPHRWRVWAISKAGVVSASEWRSIEFTSAASPAPPGAKQTTAATPAATVGPGQVLKSTASTAGDAVVAVDPPCAEWVEAAERGKPMIAPHITIRYNTRAPGARLASARSVTLVIAEEQANGVEFKSQEIPMKRAAGASWQAEYVPTIYFPGYAIFYFQGEMRGIDNHGDDYWDILNCDRGETSPFSVQMQARTYEGGLLAPGIQRAPNLARALQILHDDLRDHPTHIYRDSSWIWPYELRLGAESPAAYEQVGRELDAFLTEHTNSYHAMLELAGFIVPHQQKLPPSIVERFRKAVAALPWPEQADQINSELDYYLLSSITDCPKKAQASLSFAAKYPRSSYAQSAFWDALNCEIEMKDAAGAEAVFEKLAALDREMVDPLLKMAQFHIDQKTNLDRAVKLLDTADVTLSMNPAHYTSEALRMERGRTEFLRGQTCGLRGDWKQARAHLETAVQGSPEDAKVLYALGEACEKMGDTRPALDAYLAAASAPYEESSAPREAYERLFVVQKMGTAQDAEQKILDRIAQNTSQAAAAYTPIPFNRPAPKFSFKDLAGRPFDNQAAKGQPAVLTFWSPG